MFVLDGGHEAELPLGSGGPVLAGPEAIFIAGRVAADAETRVRLGTARTERDLVEAYDGELVTPDRILRLLNVMGDVLAAVPVRDTVTRIRIYLTDMEEPDEIVVAVEGLVLPAES